MLVSESLIVRARSVLGALSAVTYFACWTPLPGQIIGPFSLALIYLAIAVWLLAQTNRGTLRWNRMASACLMVILGVHIAAHMWLRWGALPRNDVFPSGYTGPDIYFRVGCASRSLGAFAILLGPWQKRMRSGAFTE